MYPTYHNNQKSKLRNFLLIASIVLAVLVVAILVIGTMPDNDTMPVNTDLEATITPYGTEVITPFYTPTKKPPNTTQATAAPDGPTQAVNTPVNATTPAPGTTTVPVDQSKIYKEGDSGTDIELIQKMLIAMGFDPGTADGQFGSSLENAVVQFQLYAGLDDDGVIGPTTISQIISNHAEFAPKPLSSTTVLDGIVIGIDAGHQKTENTSTEPISPSSSTTAIKATDGTYGRWTKAREYSVNLQVALKLKIELEALGATVVMTRVTNDVDISNATRAKMMNDNNVDCWVQIYSNGNDDSSKRGMMILLPKDGCMDTTNSQVYTKSNSLGNLLLTKAVSATGAKNQGNLSLSGLTSFNWSKVPVCLVEMGYMTNEYDDKLLVTKSYQTKIITGLVNGFVEYFGSN